MCVCLCVCLCGAVALGESQLSDRKRGNQTELFENLMPDQISPVLVGIKSSELILVLTKEREKEGSGKQQPEVYREKKERCSPSCENKDKMVMGWSKVAVNSLSLINPSR